MTTQLDDVLLSAYMGGFYGYGNLGAPYWFVGIEEGGGVDVDEVARRIRTWDARGRKQVEPLREFHQQIGIDEWFVSNAKAQRTWRPLIIATLTAKTERVDNRRIVSYQQTDFGSSEGDTCVLERLPLPKPNKSDWRYAELSSLDCLRTQPTYKRTLEATRIPHILRLIKRHEPSFVVLYGERKDWAKRVGLRFEKGVAFQTTAFGRSRLILTDHSGARTNDGEARFALIGEYMRDSVKTSSGFNRGLP